MNWQDYDEHGAWPHPEARADFPFGQSEPRTDWIAVLAWAMTGLLGVAAVGLIVWVTVNA